MIDPVMGAAIGGVVGSSVGQPVSHYLNQTPMAFRVGLLVALVGAATWWYFGATHSTRQKVRRATKRTR